MNDLNFLPVNEAASQIDSKTRAYVLVSIGVVTAAAAVCVVVVFLIRAYFSTQIASWQQRKEAASVELARMEEKGSKLLTLKKKAMGARVVEEARFDFQEAFSYVSNLVPTGVSLEDVSIEDSGVILVGLVSASPDSVVDYLKRVTGDQRLKDSKLTGLRLGEDGGASFGVQSNYGSGTKKSITN